MKAIPRVVIVGFPNVGKSTLFNRLLGQRKSLVHTQPGMTRDLITATWRLEDRTLMLVDTGGMFGVPDEPLSGLVREKAWAAARTADLVLFMLDGKRDASPAEAELVVDLRKSGRPLFLVVNKVDTPDQELLHGDVHRLGVADVFLVSAEHNLNIGLLREAVAAALPPGPAPGAADEPLRVAIVGRINVGKSSLINRLVGEERLLVSEVPGTTRDSTDTLVVRDGRPFCLVDTAGLRKLGGTWDSREKAGILRARARIKDADVVCQVLDVQEFPTRQDAHIAQLAKDSGKPFLLVLNKWDLVDPEVVDAEAVRTEVYRKLSFVSYAPLLFVSAQTGQRAVKILDLAAEVYANAAKRVETARLNEFLAWVNENAPPRGRDGGKIKIKYMTQAGVHPPFFLLFSHIRTTLAPAYEKHFLELLRERFDFRGTPLRLAVRAS
jgi:GTP-binding protein